jgi:putative RNA 2'-phosphotransferase
MNDRYVQTSKFLSYVLRHNPTAIGLEPDPGGWAEVAELIRRAAEAGVQLDADRIKAVVRTSDKQRFRLSEDGTRIRANYGHSFDVDLGLEPVAPPERLYHGTATRFLESILEHGIQSMGRQYVHLSDDTATALAVGRRHGRPIVLVVDAAAMHSDGHPFLRSESGVWLVKWVPPQCLSPSKPDQDRGNP